MTVLWVVASLVLTCWLFRYQGTPPHFFIFWGLVSATPYMPGTLNRVCATFCNSGFAARVQKGEAKIHLSTLSIARCRTRTDVMKHKSDLHQCVLTTLQKGHTVTMESHLLTPGRIKEILMHLDQKGLRYSTERHPRPTPAIEKAILVMTYLMSERRLVRVSDQGWFIRIVPCHHSLH